MIRLGRADRATLSSAADLRRRSTRDLGDMILARSEHLPVPDRRLLEAIYADGKTALAVAQLAGECPRKVRRRVRTLIERVTSDRFMFVLRERPAWPPTRRRVATECIVHGQSLRGAALAHGLTLHSVRRHMNAVHALFEDRAS